MISLNTLRLWLYIVILASGIIDISCMAFLTCKAYIKDCYHKWQLNRMTKKFHRLGLIEIMPDGTLLGATPAGNTAFMYLRRFKNMESE